MDSGDDIAPIETIRRGIGYSPELKEGFGLTLFLAVLASLGQVVVPIAVQQTLDHGLNAPGGPDVGFTVLMGLVAAARDRGDQRRVVPDDQPAVHARPSAGWPRCGSRRSGTCTTCRC